MGVRPAYAVTPTLLSVVRGTDNGIYFNVGDYNSPSSFSWGGWVLIPGATASAPTLCQGEELTGVADLIVRGTDNGIYHLHYASLSWGTSWDTPGGATIDQPACVAVYISSASAWFVYVVVRGTDSNLYFNTYNSVLIKPWGTWVALGGVTHSPPILVYDDYSSNPRLDLFVQGTDNGIYHKAGTINSGGGVSWATSYDGPAGTTPSAVTALWSGSRAMYVFVRGMDNAVYDNFMYLASTGTGDTFGAWTAVGGATSTAMGEDGLDNDYNPLVVIGTDSALYGTDFSVSGWYTGSLPTQTQIYASAGGSVTSPPSVTYGSPGSAFSMDVLMTGTGGGIYFDRFDATATPTTAWQGYQALGGASPSTPAVTDICTSSSCLPA